ncbi:hypothetical protein GIB67_014660 [Kingdonia uniflora]|uniref:Receptor-like serine/threonine-protein kinase n=1 Tax=Kingdonia uniflora TaxID=39325 RepID=A0A7J7LXZ4_9MAGN|nr:hypothetical protein GIB67_014660 [Kingdonia uniflora]
MDKFQRVGKELLEIPEIQNLMFYRQSLTGNQTIISQGGIFELGFFKPGSSQNYYLGIWYKQIPVQTVVWVANREVPLLSTSSVLKLSEDGNLLLFNELKILILSTNSSSLSSSSTMAVLLDTGNFVLKDGLNMSSIIWQSFEHPTDTWLPGVQLGLNKITGEVQSLTSWKNSENPSSGIFIVRMKPDEGSEFYIVWNRSDRYWNTGVWDGKSYANIPEMNSKYFFDFEYISNKREKYFHYSIKDSSILSRFVIEISGQAKQYIWLNTSQQWVLLWSRPSDPCDVYSVCGSFSSYNTICRCLHGFEPSSPKNWNLSDWSGGCVRKAPLRCGDRKDGDKFLMMPDMRFPTSSQSLIVENVEECESACLKNCSCSAYSYCGVQCIILTGRLRNLKQLPVGDVNGRDIYIRVASSELPKKTKGKKKLFTQVIVIVCVVGLGLLAVVFFLIWRYRGRIMESPWVVQGSFRPFRYRELQIATKNFSEKLEAGSFGSVYKGTLSDSTVIAVKMLEGFKQGEKEFRAEVNTIGRTQHVNLVHLCGFCSEGTKRLLVYDHMPNGSLDIHLFRKDSQLDWKMRYQIALGIAKGLSYLHEKCRDCIIHCDVKPENILLNGDFCPKIADFGLAKLFGREFSRVITTIRGTRGYLAPEWISGVGRLQNGEEILSLLEYKLEGEAEVEELYRVCNVACWCIQDNEKSRPSMGHAIQFLEGVFELSTAPIPIELLNLMENLGQQDSSSNEISQIHSSISTTYPDQEQPLFNSSRSCSHKTRR